jgi:hypothetical protein
LILLEHSRNLCQLPGVDVDDEIEAFRWKQWGTVMRSAATCRSLRHDLRSAARAYVELLTEHARKQLETLTKQTKQLATIVQKATLATTEPLKTSVVKAFSHAV